MEAAPAGPLGAALGAAGTGPGAAGTTGAVVGGAGWLRAVWLNFIWENGRRGDIFQTLQHRCI